MALLFLACLVRLLVDRRAPRPSAALVTLAVVSGLGLTLAKPAYAPIAAAFLLLPGAVVGGRRLAWLVKSLFIAALGIIVIGWTAVTSDIVDALYLQTPWPDAIDQDAQLARLLADTLAIPDVLVWSLRDFGLLWWTELPAQFGYHNVTLPFPWWLLVYLTLVLAAYASPKLPRLPAAAFLVIGIATSTAVIMSVYLPFNPVGAVSAVGVHPRYFFPVLLVTVPAITSLLPGRLGVPARYLDAAVPLLSATWLTVSLAVWLCALY